VGGVARLFGIEPPCARMKQNPLNHRPLGIEIEEALRRVGSLAVRPTAVPLLTDPGFAAVKYLCGISAFFIDTHEGHFPKQCV
jgi:hypothetical protein